MKNYVEKLEAENAVRFHQRGLENATNAVSLGYHQDRLNEALAKLRSLNA